MYLFYLDLQSPGYNRLITDNTGLRINESIGFRCWLDKTGQSSAAANPVDFIRKRLSSLSIKPNVDVERDVPSAISLGSFLMKNETKFISVLKQVSNSEEFNQIVSTPDPHMTLALTWTATVNDNNSAQRLTFGQHFVQLRNIYETVNCPSIATAAGLQPFNEHEQKISIYNVEQNASTEDEDRWSSNDV